MHRTQRLWLANVQGLKHNHNADKSEEADITETDCFGRFQTTYRIFHKLPHTPQAAVHSTSYRLFHMLPQILQATAVYKLQLVLRKELFVEKV